MGFRLILFLMACMTWTELILSPQAQSKEHFFSAQALSWGSDAFRFKGQVFFLPGAPELRKQDRLSIPESFLGSKKDPNDVEVWIDGDTLRYILAPYAESNEGFAKEVLDQIDGVRLNRETETLEIFIYFRKSFQVQISDPKKTKVLGIYGFHVPKDSRFDVRIENDVLYIEQVQVGDDVWNIFLKLPILTDQIYLHKFSADLVVGDIEFQGGILGNHILFVALGNITGKSFKFGGFDLRQTLEENFKRIFFREGLEPISKPIS